MSSSLCAKEQGTCATAEAALNDYASRGWIFYAPGVLVAEVLFVLCVKLQKGLLVPATYQAAFENFHDQLAAISPPPRGESSLIARANLIREGYGCSHSSDSLYLALVEELGQQGEAEFLTFDKDVINQVARNAPTVKVNLLPS